MNDLADGVLDRRRLLDQFLERNGLLDAGITALPVDCSFRRYYRAKRNGTSMIVMDAPPNLEDVEPFIKISDLLNQLGFSAPRVLATDVLNGFLLLDDFGDTTYTRALSDAHDEFALYCRATDVLSDLHCCALGDIAQTVAVYTDDKLLNEAVRFVDWYVVEGLGLPITSQARDDYLEAWRRCLPVVREVPDCLVLRDFHVDNLMVLDGFKGVAACGLLDFQDAVVGPMSYDLVSLLQDSRRDIQQDLVDDMLERYFGAMGRAVDRPAYMRSYFVFGAQRALKVLGVFTRQSLEYGNYRHLVHVPRLWRHTISNLSIPELAPVRNWIGRHVPEDKRLTPDTRKRIGI